MTRGAHTSAYVPFSFLHRTASGPYLEGRAPLVASGRPLALDLAAAEVVGRFERQLAATSRVAREAAQLRPRRSARESARLAAPGPALGGHWPRCSPSPSRSPSRRALLARFAPRRRLLARARVRCGSDPVCLIRRNGVDTHLSRIFSIWSEPNL